MFKYLALLFCYKALSWLPTGAAYALADLVGTAMYYVRGGLRRNVQRNMRHVMGPDAEPKKVRAAARQVMRNAARYYADLVQVPHLDMKRFYGERVEVVGGLGKLTDAIGSGRGVIIASAHYGNPEIIIQSAVAIGMEAFAITEPLHPPRLSELVHRLRESQGQVFRPLSLSVIREAIRWLRNGKVVPLLCDRDIQNTGVVLPFCGAETRMPVGAIELAMRTGALVIPMYCRRVRGGRFEVYAESPLEMTTSGNQEEDIRTNTLKLLAHFERWLRQDPSQWIVLESIWEQSESAKPGGDSLHGEG
jgi:KDO2-lipid IV(A) lauroyltransferase